MNDKFAIDNCDGSKKLFFKVGIIIDDLKNDGNLEEDCYRLTMK